ncbi:MAG: PAS domain S-box protein [candidate division KSB1 bacterium]|nr:PAS domain S-box protein [candidate division KSB1 bacterium]
MTNQDNNSKDAADLRQKAEALARKQAARTPKDSATLSSEEIRETLHELRVHQIELEMQNEELRKAQAEIEAGRARYFDLYDLAPVGYATISEKGLILEANLTAATLLSVNRGELVKQPISRFILKEDQDIYYLHRKKLFETGEPQECELRLVKPDGASFWAHLTATATQAEDGAPVCRVVLSDITERKQAEETLEREHTMLSRTEAVAHVGSWQWEVEGDKVTWSDELFRIFGLEPAEEAPSFTEHQTFYVPEDRTRLLKAVEECLSNGVPYDLEVRVMRADGQLHHCVVRGIPELGDDGAVKRLYGSLHDVTERKQAEEAREKLQAQLTQAQKMESVGRLAGGVAHDFNNMLMGIMGYADFCREEIGKDHPIQEYLDEITQSAQRSANLTRQLLAFARKQTIVPHVLDLNDAVKNMLKMLRPLIGEDIDLVWAPGANLCPVKVDPGQIDQILANLCVNARDAIAGAGKVTIETENVSIDEKYCETHADLQPGEFVMLAVSDDGTGMDSETLANIFEPFFTTKGVGEGTGLGLATVYGIVKQNKGFVSVYSEPGGGTTFSIYLPRIVEETANAKRKIPTGSRLGGTETILLVEDEKSIRVTVDLFLQDLGYTVLTAESPEAALLLATRHKDGIDLLLTDVVMPGMSGRELAEELAGGDSHMKVIYMSGYTANMIAHRGILDDNVHFVSKPITRDELAAKVRETLDHE